MKNSELNNRDRSSLAALLDDLRAKLFRLRFDLSDKKLKDVSQIGKTKKEIARVLTALKSQS